MNKSITKINQTALTRNRIAQAINGLIDLLDRMEGDPDIEDCDPCEPVGDDEPYLSTGATIWSASGDTSDLERDEAYFS